MSVTVRPTSPSPRFSGVEIQYNYAPEHPNVPEYIESITYEVVPDAVLKGVRSQAIRTHLDPVPSEAADTLTRAGKTLKDPRSTGGNGIPWYKPDALAKLLEQVTDDAGFWPTHLYPLTKMILAYGLNEQGGEAHYDTEEKTFYTKEGDETKATAKKYTVARLTIDNPFLIRRDGGFVTTQLPRASELEQIKTLEWRTRPGGGQTVHVNLPEHLIKKPAGDDGPETIELPTVKPTA